jgi:hypothetical protein
MKLEKMSVSAKAVVIVELTDELADTVRGGMLLPAIQKVRDVALVHAAGGIFIAAGDVDGDGRG